MAPDSKGTDTTQDSDGNDMAELQQLMKEVYWFHFLEVLPCQLFHISKMIGSDAVF